MIRQKALNPNAEPSFFTSLAGVFGGVVDQTATLTPEAAGSLTSSAGETSSALPIGTDWHFPLTNRVVEPTEEALAGLLAELSAAGALQDRRLGVEAQATDPALSERRALFMAARLEAIGVPATLIDIRPAASTKGDGVDVVVLPIGG